MFEVRKNARASKKQQQEKSKIVISITVMVFRDENPGTTVCMCAHT